MRNIEGGSAQPCGCDRNANYVCERHYTQQVEAETARIMRGDAIPRDHAVVPHDPTRQIVAGERLDTFHNHRYNGAEKRAIERAIGKATETQPVPRPAQTRARTLPTDPIGRKATPIASGVLDYFPDALVAVAQVSFAGNEQHNPGQPLHWAREKSTDQDDTIMRHFLQRGEFDTDGQRHSAKMAWRALALLQLEIERSL